MLRDGRKYYGRKSEKDAVTLAYSSLLNPAHHDCKLRSNASESSLMTPGEKKTMANIRREDEEKLHGDIEIVSSHGISLSCIAKLLQ